MKNYELTQGTYPSADGVSTVTYYLFTPHTPPRAIVQISHGMCEYILRYEPLASFLTGLGYLVCGNDHTGHGASVASPEDLGYTGGAEAMVKDLEGLGRLLREMYPTLPRILLGHSMGSFVARLHAVTFPGAVEALVIVGTGGPDNPTGLGKAVARLVGVLRGKSHRSRLINGMAFGSYLARIPKARGEERSAKAWLTRDREIVAAYEKDPLCSFLFTAKGYYDLFDLIGRVSDRRWANRVPDHLPVLLLSGEEDPVGGYGKGVKKVYDRLCEAGLTDLRMLLYPGARHEVFNEVNRREVMEDLAAWLAERNF